MRALAYQIAGQVSAAEFRNETADRAGLVGCRNPWAGKARLRFRVLQCLWIAWPFECRSPAITLVYGFSTAARRSGRAPLGDTFP
jgi:hypothetical protein